MLTEKQLAAGAYVFGVPALYIILTKYRYNKFLSFHAAQAFVLWVLWFLMLIGVRLGFNFLWNLGFFWLLDPLAFWINCLLWFLMAFCGYRVYKGIDFEIPVVTKLALLLW